jgi:hypothetical protein
MRQQQLHSTEAFDFVAPPKLSASDASARLQPAPAAPDMPRAAGLLIIASYAMLMGAFAVTIHGARADFAIVIGAFYLAMFFGVPAVILGVEGETIGRPDLREFLDRGIDTATGRISGAGALVQMLIVPLFLAFAILAMGITYLLV